MHKVRKRILWLALPILLVLVMNAVFSPNVHFHIKGTVVDDTGQPLPGIQIQVRRGYDASLVHVPLLWSGNVSCENYSLTADAQGAFEVSGRGTSLIISPVKEDWMPSGSPAEDYVFSFGKSGVDRVIIYRMKRLPGTP